VPPTTSSPTLTAKPPPERPNRRARRAAWAAVPRAIRDTAPPSGLKALGWLPARARAFANANIQARNDLDRALATARGLEADDPRCARFAGVERQGQLDAQVARTKRARAKARAEHDAAARAAREARGA
jgi:hypothetical protein